jgi:hypothetical protein
MHNNTLFNCEHIYTSVSNDCPGDGDGDGDPTTCSLAEMEADILLSGSAGGNINVDPVLFDLDGADNDINTMDDNDWHLSEPVPGPASPLSVTQGGFNGIEEAWSFTDDYDGNSRPLDPTIPWAIGAYTSPP